MIKKINQKKFFGLVVILACFLMLVSCAGNNSTDIPKYEIVRETPYDRDGSGSVIYWVVVDPEVDEEGLRLIYKDITKDDGYQQQTIWFYDSLEATKSEKSFNVGMLDEFEIDTEPEYSKPWNESDYQVSFKKLQEIFPEAMLTESQFNEIESRILNGEKLDALDPNAKPIKTFTKTIDGDSYYLELFEDGSYVSHGTFTKTP